MLCSVKKNMAEKNTVKPMDSLILTSRYLGLCLRSGWWLNFGMDLQQIYKHIRKNKDNKIEKLQNSYL